jgi:CheY-like chemotaxis protein
MQTQIKDIKNILVVEDDWRYAELTLAALAEYRLSIMVFVVRDGAEALDYLYRRGKFATRVSGNPVVVLLNNKSPKVSGLEVLKIIKVNENLKTIPVVVLTSSCETTDSTEFYKHGVNAYVAKPVDFTEFMKAVRQLGVFWASVNQPPPQMARAQTEPAFRPEMTNVKNENSAFHPALRR